MDIENVVTPVRTATIKKSTNNKCWIGCGGRGTLSLSWWECKLIHPLMSMCLCSSAAERDDSIKNAYLTVLLLLLLLSRFSRVWLCATPETAAHQAPPSLGFSRQEYWSGLPLPSAHSVAMSTQRLHYVYMYRELSTVQRGALLLVSLHFCFRLY